MYVSRDDHEMNTNSLQIQIIAQWHIVSTMQTLLTWLIAMMFPTSALLVNFAYSPQEHRRLHACHHQQCRPMPSLHGHLVQGHVSHMQNRHHDQQRVQNCVCHRHSRRHYQHRIQSAVHHRQGRLREQDRVQSEACHGQSRPHDNQRYISASSWSSMLWWHCGNTSARGRGTIDCP